MSHFTEMSVTFSRRTRHNSSRHSRSASGKARSKSTTRERPDGVRRGQPGKVAKEQSQLRPSCHLIIRRENVGGASNDVGYRRTEDGKYVAYISDYDRRGNFSRRSSSECRTATRPESPNGSSRCRGIRRHEPSRTEPSWFSEPSTRWAKPRRHKDMPSKAFLKEGQLKKDAEEQSSSGPSSPAVRWQVSVRCTPPSSEERRPDLQLPRLDDVHFQEDEEGEGETKALFPAAKLQAHEDGLRRIETDSQRLPHRKGASRDDVGGRNQFRQHGCLAQQGAHRP